MTEETPIQRAARLAKEKSVAENSNSSKPYSEMSYEEYLAKKDTSKKKSSSVSSSGSVRGSKTSGTQSPISQIDIQNPFNGQTQEEYIGKERADEAIRQLSLPDDSLEKQASNIKLGIDKPTVLGGFMNSNVFGDRRTPTEKEESRNLSEIVQQWEADNPGKTYPYSQPNSNGVITQGFEDQYLEGNWGKFWYNKILEGLGQTASGVGDFAVQLYNKGLPNGGIPSPNPVEVSNEDRALAEQNIKDYRENTAPTIRGYLKKNIGADVHPILENKYNDNTFVGAIGGLASSLPSIAGTIANPIAGTSMMASQMFDNSIESINSTEAGRNLDEGTKTLFASGVALAQTALERYGLNKILKSESGIVSDWIAKKAVQQAVRKADGKITGDAFSNAINKEVLDLSSKFAIGGARALDGALIEYGTEFGQETASIAGELLVNEKTGKPIFDTSLNGWTKFNKQLSRANKAGIAGFIAGKTLGGVSAMFNLNANKVNQSRLMIEEIDKSLANDQLSENTQKTLIAQKIKLEQEIDDFENKVNESYDRLTPEKKEKVNDTVERIFEIQETINDPAVTDELKAGLDAEIVELNKTLGSLAEPEVEIKEENTSKEPQPASPSFYGVGDEITLEDGKQAFIKQLLSENKAIVGVNNEGIYSEETVDLPKNKINEQTNEKPQNSEEQNQQARSNSELNQEAGQVSDKTEAAISGNPNEELNLPEEFIGKSPNELASMYNEEVRNPTLSAKEQAIYSMPFNALRDSYIQFGDRNNITASKARSYFKKNGLSLDVIAQEINDTRFDGSEIVTPQDIVDFIDRFPNGISSVIQPSGNTRLRDINNAYQKINGGKRLNQKTAADIVSSQQKLIESLPDEAFNDVDTESIRIINEEGVTLDNIDKLENAIKFIYGDQAFDDLKAYLIFGPSINTNDTTRQTSGNSEGSTEIGRTDSQSSELEERIISGTTGQDSRAAGDSGARIENEGRINEATPSENIESDETVQSNSSTGSNTSEDDSFQSSFDARSSEIEAQINEAQIIADSKSLDVLKLQLELKSLANSLQENLNENQTNIFGQNKTQSVFDDRAEQIKIYEEKLAELVKAQNELAEAKNSLSELKENLGQIDLFLPEKNVVIDGDEINLAETNSEEDAKIIEKSIFNPLSVLSQIQKGVDKIENKFSEKFSSKVADGIAESLKSWRTSKTSLKQIASSYLTSILGGIARTNKDANAKLGLIGGKNLAVFNMSKIMKAAYDVVDNNTDSLERIHVVLDPDFYQQGLGGQTNTNKPNVPPNLTYGDLTYQEQLLYDELRNMLDDIHFKNYALGFISKDTFDKYKGNYVPRMYETFELPAEVQEVLDTYNAQVGDKLNLNPFKRRKGLDKLSEESKNALVKDPVYLAAKRQMELDTNSAIMTYINHIARDNRSLVHTGDANVPFNYEKLEGKAYGALNGKYVPSYLAEDLRGYFFVNKSLNQLYDSIKAYDRTWARKGIKKGLTVFNPFVQIGNFTSNVVFAQMAGIDFVRWFGNSPKALKALKEKGQDYEDLVGAGLIGTDVITSELMPNTENANSLLQESEAKKLQGPFGKILSGVKSIDKALLKLYSGNDDYAKINAYQILREQGYSKEDAVKKVYDGFQNYATVGKFWDVASKLPVFGNPFQKFSADLMRITGNAVTKKPLSTSLYLAGLYYMPNMILSAIGWDEEETELEKDLRENRPFIPKMDLGAVNIPLVYKTKYGELNLARYITPYFYFDNGEDGALSSMAERFMPVKTVATQGYGKGNERNVLFGQDPILGTLYNALILDTDFRGKSISDPEASRYRASGITDGEKWKNIFANAARTWVPNGGLIHDTYLNAKYGEDYYGRTRNMAQALINFAVKIQRFEEGDYKKTAEKQLFSLANELKGSAETIKNAMVLNYRQRQKSAKDYKDGKKTLADYQNSLQKLDKTLKKRLVELNAQLETNQKDFIGFKTKYKTILDR